MIRICLLQVSAPDRHGFCSLGTSVDCVPAALMHSRTIIGKIQIDSEPADARVPAQCTEHNVRETLTYNSCHILELLCNRFEVLRENNVMFTVSWDGELSCLSCEDRGHVFFRNTATG